MSVPETGRPARSGADDAGELRGVKLIVTSDCNFRCDYCCQNDKKPGAMEWRTARAAVDRMLASGRDDVELGFWGGEPLLQSGLVRRVVGYARERGRPGMTVRFAISTNGALLTEGAAAFLAKHRFRTQLSFDGVEAAQRHREKGSFDKLDRVLRMLRSKEPSFYRDQLTVAITVTPDNLPHLPRSIDYFLHEDMRNIALAPLFTPVAAKAKVRLIDFENAFDRVLLSSIRHFERTGLVPVALFRGGGGGDGEPRPEGSSLTMCGIRSADFPSVEPDGSASGCVALVRSVQKPRSTRFAELLPALAMGPVDSDRFDEKRAAFRDRIDNLEVFMKKEEKYSSFGRCGECEFLEQCSVCPVSIADDPGNGDPRRVSDFYCAFNLAALGAARRFPAASAPAALVRDGSRMRARMEEFLVRADTGVQGM